ncbi:MAG: superoxide dismutase [bacterium]|nr:superoxide dismutase [bacterium]
MPHTLPKLPYAHAALEPYLDARTMEIHHGKHHQAYVDNLNKALEPYPKLQQLPLEELVAQLSTVPEAARTAVRNNGGGHLNHSWYWEWMAPKAAGKPDGKLAKAIEKEFGGFSAFQEQFTKAGMTRFGSGWAWLVIKDGKLSVLSTPNQDNPMTDGLTPLLGCDVWEHAYYLKYQNRRVDYLAAWWNVVNWENVAGRFATAQR